MDLPEACLFDLDGLLIDTEPLHGEAWSLAARSFGGELPKEKLLKLRGRRRIDCVKLIIGWLDKPIKEEEFLKVHRPIARKLLKKSKAIEFAEELVKWCFENNLPMALVTSSTSESFNFKSSPHPWLKLIETRVLGDDKKLKRGKPSPDPYLLAAEKLNKEATLCWAFEDSNSGKESAILAGCKVWFLQNEKNKKTSNEKNIVYIKSLNEVLEILKDIKGII